MRRALLLDACVVINLCAAGLWREVAEATGMRFVIVDQVAGEAPRVLDGQGQPQPIDLDAMQAAGTLEVWSLIDEELAYFVAFARRLDDGEAATLAAAVARGLPLATDDRVARRVAASLPAAPQLLDTCELMHTWATTTAEDPSRVGAVLRQIRERARFVAPADNPHSPWWHAHLTPK